MIVLLTASSVSSCSNPSDFNSQCFSTIFAGAASSIKRPMMPISRPGSKSSRGPSTPASIPTADSLHVGSLLPLLMLRRFQRRAQADRRRRRRDRHDRRPQRQEPGTQPAFEGRPRPQRRRPARADAAVPGFRRPAETPPSSSTTSIGSARSAISNSSATSARTFPST